MSKRDAADAGPLPSSAGAPAPLPCAPDWACGGKGGKAAFAEAMAATGDPRMAFMAQWKVQFKGDPSMGLPGAAGKRMRLHDKDARAAEIARRAAQGYRRLKVQLLTHSQPWREVLVPTGTTLDDLMEEVIIKDLYRFEGGHHTTITLPDGREVTNDFMHDTAPRGCDYLGIKASTLGIADLQAGDELSMMYDRGWPTQITVIGDHSGALPTEPAPTAYSGSIVVESSGDVPKEYQH